MMPLSKSRLEKAEVNVPGHISHVPVTYLKIRIFPSRLRDE